MNLNALQIGRGKRLESLIKKKRWKKKELAAYSAIKETHVNSYLSGEFDPVKIIDKLFLNEHINKEESNYLLTGEENNLIIKEENQAYNPNLEQRIKELENEIINLKEKLVDYSDALLEKDKKIREYEKKPSLRVQSSTNG